MIKLTGLLLIVLLLSACGSHKSVDSLELASRATETTISASTNKAWSKCNQATSGGGQFKMILSAYVQNGVIRSDLMNGKLTLVPDNFVTSQEYFQMFRWQANSGGAAYLDQTPLQFRLINPANGQVLLSERTSIAWTEVATLASQMNISNPTDFFKKVVFVIDLRDPQAAFDALMVSIYRTNNTSRDVANLLLPVFDADPAVYALENGKTRHTSLQALHPFKDKLGQGWNDKDFQTWADGLCNGF
jgi:hypothetical protein